MTPAVKSGLRLAGDLGVNIGDAIVIKRNALLGTPVACDDAGDARTYRIVGPDEADAKTAAISMDSPLAKALHKKCVDDDVQVTIGDKTRTLTILSIHYKQDQ